MDIWPLANRRKEERIVVEGLDAFVDGFPCEIIDIAPTAVRLVRPDLAPLIPERIVLTLRSHGGAPPLDVAAKAYMIRENWDYIVVGYEKPMQGWTDWIRRYDAFADGSAAAAAGA